MVVFLIVAMVTTSVVIPAAVPLAAPVAAPVALLVSPILTVVVSSPASVTVLLLVPAVPSLGVVSTTTTSTTLVAVPVKTINGLVKGFLDYQRSQLIKLDVVPLRIVLIQQRFFVYQINDYMITPKVSYKKFQKRS